MAEPQTPSRDTRTVATLTTLGKAIERATRLHTRTVVPAKVVEYDTATQRAKIELGFKIRYHTQESTEDAPALVIPSVPVLWPSTAGGYLTLPLVAGDTGIALISDRSMSDWRIDGEPRSPTLTHTHNLADCVFLPGLRPDTDPITPAPAANAVQLEASLIKLGMNASQAAVLGDAFRTLFNVFTDAFRLHTHIAPPGGGTTDPPSTSAAVQDMTSAQLSAKVKVDA